MSGCHGYNAFFEAETFYLQSLKKQFSSLPHQIIYLIWLGLCPTDVQIKELLHDADVGQPASMEMV